MPFPPGRDDICHRQEAKGLAVPWGKIGFRQELLPGILSCFANLF